MRHTPEQSELGRGLGRRAAGVYELAAGVNGKQITSQGKTTRGWDSKVQHSIEAGGRNTPQETSNVYIAQRNI